MGRGEDGGDKKRNFFGACTGQMLVGTEVGACVDGCAGVDGLADVCTGADDIGV